MEEIIFSLKHYWRFVDSEALDLKALSWGGRLLCTKSRSLIGFFGTETDLFCREKDFIMRAESPY
jgi:hypothetical protein